MNMSSEKISKPEDELAAASSAAEPQSAAPTVKKKMDFDDILEELGEFGRYQITNYILICLPVLFSAANSLTYVFTAGVPEYRCLIPGCDNASHPVYSEKWVKEAIPPTDHQNTGGQGSKYVPDQCLMYVPQEDFTNMTCPLGHFTEKTTRCDNWVFEDNERTIVGEWNITCLENQWKLSMVGTVHFAGILIGSIMFGLLADKFGRKQIFVFCILLMSGTGIAQAVAPNYITFQVFVFINAMGTAGVYPTAFIIGVELVGRKKREMSGIILNYFYAIGEALIGLVAWLTKDWVIIQLAVSAPPAIFVLYYWLVPESVRWLITKKKNRKASEIVKKAAKVNRVVLSQRLLSTFEDEEGILAKPDPNNDTRPPSIWRSIMQICRSRKLVCRSINLFYNWAANAFVFYGLSVNSTSLGGNKYLNFALVALVEIPGYTLAWIAMNRLGRRWSLAGSMILCGVTCICAAFVPEDMNWAVVTLFLIGKLGITCSFGVIVVYTAELYPTVMRSIGVGTSSTVARIGAMIAPFAPLLGIYMTALPLILFGVVSFLAGALALFFPETLGAKLPDSVEELENLP